MTKEAGWPDQKSEQEGNYNGRGPRWDLEFSDPSYACHKSGLPDTRDKRKTYIRVGLFFHDFMASAAASEHIHPLCGGKKRYVSWPISYSIRNLTCIP